MTRGMTRRAVLGGLAAACGGDVSDVLFRRRELRSLLGTGERRPSLLVRFGFGPPMPRSLRRSVRDVLVTS